MADERGQQGTSCVTEVANWFSRTETECLNPYNSGPKLFYKMFLILWAITEKPGNCTLSLCWLIQPPTSQKYLHKCQKVVAQKRNRWVTLFRYSAKGQTQTFKSSAGSCLDFLLQPRRRQCKPGSQATLPPAGTALPQEPLRYWDHGWNLGFVGY